MFLEEYSLKDLAKNPAILDEERMKLAKELNLPENSSWEKIRQELFLELFRLQTLMIQ